MSDTTEVGPLSELAVRLRALAAQFNNPNGPNGVSEDMQRSARLIEELLDFTGSQGRISALRLAVDEHNADRVETCNTHRKAAGTFCKPPAKCEDCPLRERLSVRVLST